MSVGVYGDQEIVANGFCGMKCNKKSRRVKITFLGGLLSLTRAIKLLKIFKNKNKEERALASPVKNKIIHPFCCMQASAL